MRLSKEAIEEFREIYPREFGERMIPEDFIDFLSGREESDREENKTWHFSLDDKSSL